MVMMVFTNDKIERDRNWDMVGTMDCVEDIHIFINDHGNSKSNKFVLVTDQDILLQIMTQVKPDIYAGEKVIAVCYLKNKYYFIVKC